MYAHQAYQLSVDQVDVLELLLRGARIGCLRLDLAALFLALFCHAVEVSAHKVRVHLLSLWIQYEDTVGLCEPPTQLSPSQSQSYRDGRETNLVNQRLDIFVDIAAQELCLCLCQQDGLVRDLVRAAAAALLCVARRLVIDRSTLSQ